MESNKTDEGEGLIDGGGGGRGGGGTKSSNGEEEEKKETNASCANPNPNPSYRCLVVLALLFLLAGGIVGGFVARDVVLRKQQYDEQDDHVDAAATTTKGNGAGVAAQQPPVDGTSPRDSSSRFPPSGAWEPTGQVSSVLEGVTPSHVALSGSGTTLAVADGLVQMYQYYPVEGWRPWGDPLQGSQGKITELALSKGGQVVLVGGASSVLAYSLSGSSSWTAMGQEIAQAVPLALSPDGTVVAACTSSYVKVFHYNVPLNLWMELGSLPSVTCDGDTSLDLSLDGSILAVGDEDGANYYGQVQVYHYYSNDGWTPMGSAIAGMAHYGSFGSTVRLSEDGSVLAVGSRRYNGSYGLVKVFRFSKSSQQWEPVGQELIGLVDGAQFGWTVSLSADGAVLAVGSYEAAVATVFYYDGIDWIIADSNLPLSVFLPYLGSDVYSISLSSNGTTVAVATNTAQVFTFRSIPGGDVYSYAAQQGINTGEIHKGGGS